MEEIFEEQLKKKRWTKIVKDPLCEYLKRPSGAQEQIHNQNMLGWNEMATINTPAEKSKSCPDLKPAESPRSLLDASGGAASRPSIHASSTDNTWKASGPTEEMEGHLTTAVCSVETPESLYSGSAHPTQSSYGHPYSNTNRDISEDARDSIDLDHRDSMPDSEDEGFWFNAESPDLYFQTGIEITI